MTNLLNTYEQADFERLAAFYPYRDEHGLPVLEESLKDYAKRTNQTVNAVKRQADRAALPINQEEKNSKRTVNLFAIFLKTIRNAEKYVQITK
ncbi:TPA: DNA-binding protein [Escherichia coli]|uniref:DNA-binding protein n=1 Tax=Escherichia coli TaxID=562 RepID=UPI000E211F0D|nr:DNA-binding protein [Escherichia coli]EFV6957277.1 DNA-binding protein [Escherichia coli]MDL7433905.1 DNA-binding protein [Escherichia coli]HAM5603904.1 DNA-binding protein [Escherichia coli]HDX1865170.1 DNA-binding protein [Escherichia coli]HDZ4026339.1 DNA-binding protein [Escherichia coli]